ncbi:3'-5' exoribonuclease YhaM family protein [Lignipirellula cremea]|uniref:3'-5' exoribonuclease YhaM n=1 Tax=Lignipirellula cremea TaxID=2528010 RepID=A0A518DUK8_9BACT|nr:HD domain-containing protein [Lignipirellula cremea]QDU95522.1 3'-5' exoribonuclease YhaM [Lignipirellula cremea]
MVRRFINQLGEREAVDEVFLVAEKQLRANRNGNLYLQMRLSDKSGSLTAMLWNATDQIYSRFDNGDYLRVQGTVQLYNGAMQMIVNKFEQEPTSEIDEADFITLAAAQVDRLASRVGEMLRSMQNLSLRNLAECFLMDDSFMSRFTKAPAGVKNHHAYHGGLLEHVASLMELVTLVAPRYPELDPDLLLMGAFLHDLGKIDELTYERDLGYSDEGQLIGHLVIGVELLNGKIREAENLAGEPFPRPLALHLKHLIVSHHGEYAFGSPKLPMSLEAVALHHLDNLDAKIHSLGQIIRDDANTDSNWTPYQAALGRKLYKGALVENETGDAETEE